MTAALYTARAGLKTLILEKESIGGQISDSSNVENYPGFIKITGIDFSMKMYDQVLNAGAQFEFETATEIKTGDTKKVLTETNEYEAKTIIIATGANYKRLGTESEKKFIGKGIHFCATCDAAFYKDKEVAIIGGGNTAVTNALTLSDYAKKVYLIYRRDKLRCEFDLEEKIKKIKNIEVIYDTNVIEFIGEENLEELKLDTKGKITNLKIDGVFESIGMVPSTKFIVNVIDIDEEEYIVSENCYTDKEGVFVAGDVRVKEVRQLTTATSDGTIAATHAIDYVKKTSK